MKNMSKKKAFSGNTMTLKDFHGGSIPTDLPLPSAPGVIVRPTDRSGYDRPTSWGNPMGRPDNRVRPNSSPATRHFNNKTPFLAHPGHIGRNFDEDERKPLDGVSAPRRTVCDESFRDPPSRVELRAESVSTGRVPAWAVSQISSVAVNSYAGRVAEQPHTGVNSPYSGGNNGWEVSGSYPNAWTAMKEVAVSITEPVQSGLSPQSVVSKLSHASALEKVSSGRWQSKHSAQYHADVQVIQYSETDDGLRPKGFNDNNYNRIDVMCGREFPDATLVRHIERGLNIEDGYQGGRKEELENGRTDTSSYLEEIERKPAYYTDRVQHGRSDGKFSAPASQFLVHSEVSERPKLKLLPRTKPLENLEPNIANPKQGYQQLSETVHCPVETVNGLHGNGNTTKPDLSGGDGANHAVECPKLNLKPRSQTPEQLIGNIDWERNQLFGGARPRELVLRERGIDDVAINSCDSGQHSTRVNHNISKTERAPELAAPACQVERAENVPPDQRIGRKFERKVQQVDVERTDIQRRNWRNDNRRNGRGTEREQQRQQQERLPSPETWRKPVEQQPNLASADAVGSRYGKISSAVELAQAFSRSFSDSKFDDGYSSRRGLPGRTRIPFSRLMGPTPRPQINGY